MAYATIADIQLEIPERELISLTDDNRTGQFDAAAQAVAQEALDSAEGELNTYARGRYKLPLPATPEIRKMTLIIAKYLLITRRSTTVEGKFEVWERAYRNVIELLKRIAESKASFDAIPPTTEPSSNLTTVRDDRTPVFNDEALESF